MGRGKSENPEKILRARREPSLNSTRIWHRAEIWTRATLVAGRRALSPLCHPCAPNRLFRIADLSSPVCLFCGSRHTAKVYLLDINKKEMRTLDVDVSNQSHCFNLLGCTSRKHRVLCFATSIWCRNQWARSFCLHSWLSTRLVFNSPPNLRVTHKPLRKRRLFGLFWRLIKRKVFLWHWSSLSLSKVMIDNRSYIHSFSSCEIKAWKKYLSLLCSLSR